MYTETFVGILAEAVVAQRFSRRADHAESVWQLGRLPQSGQGR